MKSLRSPELRSIPRVCCHAPSAHYYRYMGSVTAPPCTEHVAWFVLKTPVEISPQQINAFAELYPNDARPVQPLNGRIVKESR